MYEINADVLHNRIYVIFKGRLDVSELKLAGGKIILEAKLLKPGFGAILDFTELVPGVIDGRQIMVGVVHSLHDQGLGKAVSVVRDIAAKEAMTQPISDINAAVEEGAVIEEPWDTALSIRHAEKILDKYATINEDGVTTFTKRYKILIIDDELALLTVLSNILKRTGYEVSTAINGNKGIENAKKTIPDLIICDVMMPSPNGFRVRDILSEDPGTAAIPFIFLTARTAKGDTIYALRSGADDYVTKPFDRGELVARIEAVLRRTQKVT